MRVAITGANGYIGSNVVSRLERDGDTVIRLVRNAGGDPGAVRYSLGETLPASSLGALEALVHCAYDFMQPTPEASVAINVEGTRNLFRSASGAGVRRIVFISSMSAFASCRSAYGRTKLAIEEVAAEFGAVIVRPGKRTAECAGRHNDCNDYFPYGHKCSTGGHVLDVLTH